MNEVTIPAAQQPGVEASDAQDETGDAANQLALADFIEEFGDGLLEQVKAQNPPVFDSALDEPTAVWCQRQTLLDGLKRKPFKAQADAVQAVVKLLVDQNRPAAIINAEMGTGKTMMAICAAVVLQRTHPRTLVISPPHLVYKWRREILDTVPQALVWILNGPDTLRKLIQLRQTLGLKSGKPEFFILGRVRMRMGFHWRPSFVVRRLRQEDQTLEVAACPSCMAVISREDEDGHPLPVSAAAAHGLLSDRHLKCQVCSGPLWTLIRTGKPVESMRDLVVGALKQMPTIGEKTAVKLVNAFGEEMLGAMLDDNVYEFLNLMDENGDLVFGDRQMARMERSLANFEFSIGQGGYQATEFVKRYLPRNYFGLLVVDEGMSTRTKARRRGRQWGCWPASAPRPCCSPER